MIRLDPMELATGMYKTDILDRLTGEDVCRLRKLFIIKSMSMQILFCSMSFHRIHIRLKPWGE